MPQMKPMMWISIITMVILVILTIISINPKEEATKKSVTLMKTKENNLKW